MKERVLNNSFDIEDLVEMDLPLSQTAPVVSAKTSSVGSCSVHCLLKGVLAAKLEKKSPASSSDPGKNLQCLAKKRKSPFDLLESHTSTKPKLLASMKPSLSNISGNEDTCA